MPDFTRVDWESLKAARSKMRVVIKQLEEGKRPHDDILHPAYKLSQFLAEALPDAWDAVEETVPDSPDVPDTPDEEAENRAE